MGYTTQFTPAGTLFESTQYAHAIFCVYNISIQGKWDITVCPRSSDPFYIVISYIKWVTTYWTDGRRKKNSGIKVKSPVLD